ncbi:hypothetical protein HPB51_019803 [Rhipicephalus microplus]|uniref:Uncharacterized protein n=1 Tax=Rhipicephalus microplus TaxID=6941 RepID=A0A9J6EBJ3_RHIMP|nr:hypothetical protein HPB51_019803 [Rhipicephalus microplus]
MFADITQNLGINHFSSTKMRGPQPVSNRRPSGLLALEGIHGAAARVSGQRQSTVPHRRRALLSEQRGKEGGARKFVEVRSADPNSANPQVVVHNGGRRSKRRGERLPVAPPCRGCHHWRIVFVGCPVVRPSYASACLCAFAIEAR